MPEFIKKHSFFSQVDWLLLLFLLPILGAGLVTMSSFLPSGEAGASFFGRQIIWITISFKFNISNFIFSQLYLEYIINSILFSTIPFVCFCNFFLGFE